MRIAPEPAATAALNPALQQSQTPNRLGADPDHDHDSGSSEASEATLGSSSVGLTAQAMAQPEVRTGLVAQFRAQIASGTYQPAAGDIANAMVNDPLTGLGGGKPA